MTPNRFWLTVFSLIRLARKRRHHRRDFAPALLLRGLHVFQQLIRQTSIQLRAARLIAEYPGNGRNGLRYYLNFLVINLLRSVAGAVIIGMQAHGKKSDRDSHFGEVVMIASIEDALAVRLRAKIIVSGVGGGRVVEMVYCELLVAAIYCLDRRL